MGNWISSVASNLARRRNQSGQGRGVRRPQVAMHSQLPRFLVLQKFAKTRKRGNCECIAHIMLRSDLDL